MDTQTRQSLHKMDNAIYVLSDEAGQDRTLVLDMSLAMIADMIATGDLKPMSEYARFIDCVDNDQERDALIASMDALPE